MCQLGLKFVGIVSEVELPGRPAHLPRNRSPHAHFLFYCYTSHYYCLLRPYSSLTRFPQPFLKLRSVSVMPFCETCLLYYVTPFLTILFEIRLNLKFHLLTRTVKHSSGISVPKMLNV
jgi:hypothetical protein